MDNLVDSALPLQIQLTKRGIRESKKNGRIQLDPQQSYFWTDKYEKAATNLVNNFLPPFNSNNSELAKKEIVANLIVQLTPLYNKALTREREFLAKLGIKNITQPTGVDEQVNASYVKEFNKAVEQKLFSATGDLNKLFLDSGFASSLTKGGNAFSFTRAAEKAGVTKNEVSKDLGLLFLTPRALNETGKNGAKRVLEVGVLNILNSGDKTAIDNWFNSLADYFDKYVGEAMGNALRDDKNGKCRTAITKNMGEILKQSLEPIFATGKTKLVRIGNDFNTQSAFSKEVTQALKSAFKQTAEIIIGTGSVQIKVGDSGSGFEMDKFNGGLAISSDKNIGDDYFNVNVNIKVSDTNLRFEMVKILFDALRYKGIEYVRDHLNEYDVTAITNEFEKYRNKFIDVILIDLQNNQDSIKNDYDVQKVLRRWGYAQTRGLLGELAAAIGIQSSTGYRTSVTGSQLSDSGEVAMDVVMKMQGSLFGFQVKNFKSYDVKNLYARDFGVKQERVMRKYFGEFTDVYYWLFTNEKMLHETGLIGVDFRDRIEQSFYYSADNFLRISAGDKLNKETGEEIFSQSDAFIIKGKVIPSSYLYYRLLQMVRNNAVPRIVLQSETNENENPEMKSKKEDKSYEFHAVPVKSLVNGMNARIEFKGINLNLKNILDL